MPGNFHPLFLLAQLRHCHVKWWRSFCTCHLSVLCQISTHWRIHCFNWLYLISSLIGHPHKRSIFPLRIGARQHLIYYTGSELKSKCPFLVWALHLHVVLFNVSFSHWDKTELFYQTEAIKWLPRALFQRKLTVTLTTLTVVSLFMEWWRGERGSDEEWEGERTVSPWSETSLHGYKERWHVWLYLCLIEFSAPLR